MNTATTTPHIESPDDRCNGLGAGSRAESNQREQSTPLTKKERVLSHFLAGEKLNRFQAEKIVHCHCLNSSISTLTNVDGILFDREWETVPALNGCATARVKSYWLRIEPDNIRRALAVLGRRFDGSEATP